MIKGIIIDFNGTLFLDHDLNDYAWGKAFDSVKNKDASFKEFFETNIETLTKDYDFAKRILETFNKDSSLDSIKKLSKYKEETYINEVIKQKRNKLIHGAPAFFDYLKNNNIPYSIASMAPRMNFDFYLEYLNLKKWFNYDNIVYDSKEYSNKNEQYLEAAKRMNVDVSECLLIEDSPKVINRALDTGINNIIYMNTKNEPFHIKEIIQEVNDYTNLPILIEEIINNK